MNTYNWKFHADCLLHVFSENYKGCILTHFRLKSAPLTIYWRSDFNFRYIIIVTYLQSYTYELPASVAQLDAPSDWRPGGRGFNPRRGLQHSFVEIDHEIFSTVILSLPLIQEGQLSVSGERMCTILVNRLED